MAARRFVLEGHDPAAVYFEIGDVTVDARDSCRDLHVRDGVRAVQREEHLLHDAVDARAELVVPVDRDAVDANARHAGDGAADDACAAHVRAIEPGLRIHGAEDAVQERRVRRDRAVTPGDLVDDPAQRTRLGREHLEVADQLERQRHRPLLLRRDGALRRERRDERREEDAEERDAEAGDQELPDLELAERGERDAQDADQCSADQPDE